MNLRTQMAKGSAWMFAGRWSMRAIGLVSTVILARLLTPLDFGLIAMATLVSGALQVLADAGHRAALIRMKEPTRAHYDSSWTLGIGIGIAISLLILLAAWPAATLFSEPKVMDILLVLALRPLVTGFTNVGLVDIQRRLDFRRDLQLMVIGKLGGFAVTVVLAVLLRNYWALPLGTLAQALIGTLLSYVYSPYRPRLDVSRIRELTAYSLWSLGVNLGTFLGERADQSVIGIGGGAVPMGVFAIADEVASTPTQEAVQPPVRALFAVYSRVAHDRTLLSEHYFSALGILATIALSISIGTALVADDLIAVFFGERWKDAAVIVPWLAIAAGVFGITRTTDSVMMAAGFPKIAAIRSFGFLCALIPAGTAGYLWNGAEGVAVARLVVTLVAAPILFSMVLRVLGARPAGLLGRLWRPAAAGAVMAAVVLSVEPLLPPLPIVRLLLEAMIGAAVFVATLLAAWLVAGRPAGSEADVLALVRRKLLRGKG